MLFYFLNKTNVYKQNICRQFQTHTTMRNLIMFFMGLRKFMTVIFIYITHLLRQWNDKKSPERKKTRISRTPENKEVKKNTTHKCKRCCRKIIRLPVSDFDDKQKARLPARNSGKKRQTDRQTNRKVKLQA